MPKLKRIKKDIKAIVANEYPTLNGLEQSFKGHNGQQIVLKDILVEKEWWVLKQRKSQSTIITHDGVKKIADAAGLSKSPKYSILISPTHENNYTIAMQAEICDNEGKCTTEIGEVNRNNLGSRGRANPVNMAQKRAYDRAVFRHLGITGLLGEDELQDEEEKTEMETLTDEQKIEIVPFINKIWAATNQAELKAVADEIKVVTTFIPEQIIELRKAWKKQAAEILSKKTF
jgi:hypothetical protein